MSEQKFIIRVYGIYINVKNHILVSEESYDGLNFTKFPGGGLEKGEGTIECLKREFKEELGVNISIIKHYYTTDFYQKSVFDSNHQIISIYYLIKADEAAMNKAVESANNLEDNGIFFKWLSLENLSIDNVTFPIDKKVVELLLKKQLPNGV